MAALHKTMAQGRWAEMSFAERMGNIGSEVSRARGADERGNMERRNASLDRALELVDLTMAPENNSRRTELGRLRGALIRIRGQAKAEISLSSIEQYLLPFGVLARKSIYRPN